VTLLVPDAVLDANGVRRGCAVELAGDRIATVSTHPRSRDCPPDMSQTVVPGGQSLGPGSSGRVSGGQGSAGRGVRLDGVALAPGFVNGHSHAFQRDLRGRVERPGDFWSWRDEMLAAAAALDPASIHDVARRCYRAMRRAGTTSVSEFHYVHHRPDGTPYDDPNALAEAVCEAAEAEGLRICLLLTAYERGGHPRFRDPDVEAFLARFDALRAWAAARPLVSVGVAAHSVRAVSRPWLERLANVDGPLHVHAGEQPREVEECLAEHGLRPIELLAESGFLSERTTVVHATHADARELELLAGSGATVCLCPTTEGNLGDGWPPAERLLAAGVPLAIGSDSNVRLDPLEELRELETVARRVALRRNVLPLPALLGAAWTSRIEPGAPADLVAIDLRHDALAGVADEDLAAALVFSGDASAVVRTWVAGS
jgi:formimidoylglutamate deiminase